MAILLVVTILQRSVGFGRGVLFCRWMTPEALGQWEMVFSFLLLAAPLAVLGVPGSFGRYAEHYRQRGQLRPFLFRALGWTAACAMIAMALVATFASEAAQLVFGDASYAGLMRGIALCLGAVIMHHTLIALLTSLRLYRAVSAMNFAQSMVFAVVSLVLLLWRPSPVSILVGYGVACAAASLGAILWAWPGLRDIERPLTSPTHREFWPKLMRFAFFVWLTNFLTHMFAIVDRYMIVHYSGLESAEALEQVGHYHSSRIVPLLMLSFADLLAGLILPHLTSDWERGRLREVSKRLNLTIKLTSIGMFTVGVGILFCGPHLFEIVLQGRYDDGLAVLPWTLAACVWYSLHLLTQTYLFCAEKTRLATVPLVAGLTANVVLNLLLLPIWGLYGAVVATAVGTAVCMSSTLLASRRQGMTIDRGTWLVVAAPLLLGFGAPVALAALLVIGYVSMNSTLVLSHEDRASGIRLVRERLRQLGLGRRDRAATGG